MPAKYYNDFKQTSSKDYSLKPMLSFCQNGAIFYISQSKECQHFKCWQGAVAISFIQHHVLCLYQLHLQRQMHTHVWIATVLSSTQHWVEQNKGEQIKSTNFHINVTFHVFSHFHANSTTCAWITPVLCLLFQPLKNGNKNAMKKVLKLSFSYDFFLSLVCLCATQCFQPILQGSGKEPLPRPW